MRKQDVVNAVAAQVTMTPRDVRAVLAGIDLVVGEAVMRGEDVTLGFVKFEPVTLPPRVQRLPSGELKELGERRRVKARPCKSLAGLSGLRLVAGWRACRVSPPLLLPAASCLACTREVLVFLHIPSYSSM